MKDLPSAIRDAHDEGRSDTRTMLASGEMSDEYANKLARGSLGLAFWIAAATSVWLLLGRHWAWWKVALLFLFAWYALSIALGMFQALVIGAILARRKRHAP